MREGVPLDRRDAGVDEVELFEAVGKVLELALAQLEGKDCHCTGAE